MFRLGEATHPGPKPAMEPGGLQIGCINLTGLLGKSHLVRDLPREESTIWAVSESHLTHQGRKKCTDELKYHNAGYQLHAGAAVAPPFQFSLSHRRQASRGRIPFHNADTHHVPNMATRGLGSRQIPHVCFQCRPEMDSRCSHLWICSQLGDPTHERRHGPSLPACHDTDSRSEHGTKVHSRGFQPESHGLGIYGILDK